MPRISFYIEKILLFTGFMFLGVLVGFGGGIYWTVNQAGTLVRLDAAAALDAAEYTINIQTEEINQYRLLIEKLQQQVLDLGQMVEDPVVVPQLNRQPMLSPIPQRYYTGEELMQAVNKYRREHGVPELQLHSGLCQLASRRLGELIKLGDLDNHAGFENYFNDHQISELSGPSLTNVAENLASGYTTAWETVMGWDSSPPHRTFLLADGSYNYGCGSANLNYAVLIGGF